MAIVATTLMTIPRAVSQESTALAEASGEENTASATQSAKNLSLAFKYASEKALPSVVKILCKSRRSGDEPSVLDIIDGDDEHVYDNVGSGVIVSSDGLILTNHHVVQDAFRINVQLNDGREFKAEKTQSDERSDVAILHIESDDELPIAEIGVSRELFVGSWVLAIGSPFMLESSVSAGIISGTGRRRKLSNVVSGVFLQTDAAINPGNSGGPLVDLDGRVVGINTAISSRTGGFQGIGFAIPIDRANWIKNELLEYGKVRRAYIGVGTERVPYAVAKQLGLPRTAGAMVARLGFGYPGQQAGLRVGDIVVEFADQQIDSPQEFAEVVQQSRIGEPLTAVLLREGKKVELEITLIPRPGS